MAEPRVVDVRDGLTAEVLDGLRRADRVVLAVKGADTAVLGYWIGEELGMALIASAVTRMLLAPHRVGSELTPDMRPAMVHPRSPGGVVLDIAHAREDEFWSRALGVLRVGDVLRVAHDAEAPSRAALQITSQGARVGSLRLPKPPRAKSEAA
jgi:hypothetical protein